MAVSKPTVPAARTRLPDFCHLPVLFALLVLAALVVLVMLLAPGSVLSWRSFTVAVAFAVWLAIACGVLLCKLRPYLQRLSALPAWGIVWFVIVAVVLVGSALVWWLDQGLLTHLAPADGVYFIASNTAVAALVGAALLRYFYVLTQWQDRVQAASQARVQALQARIRPHFLFNSMNTVAALVRLDPGAAETTIENLAEMFRAALGADDRSWSLGDELALIERYLAIEQLRLGERLRVQRDLADAPRELPLPRLLWQPIVENAIYHGIQNRPTGGTLRLAAERDGDVLRLSVRNDRADTPVAQHDGHGHALDNIRHRLGYHYGERARLETHREHDRYRVTMSLPMRTP